jgi:hypothetical protein
MVAFFDRSIESVTIYVAYGEVEQLGMAGQARGPASGAARG